MFEPVWFGACIVIDEGQNIPGRAGYAPVAGVRDTPNGSLKTWIRSPNRRRAFCVPSELPLSITSTSPAGRVWDSTEATQRRTSARRSSVGMTTVSEPTV